ncbi:MAG: hypothetical protein AAFV53_37735 [Myxococcota bacterium]
MNNDELSVIDPGPVQRMREQEEVEADKLRVQIAQLQEQLAVREARIAVLDEVLKSCQVDVVVASPPSSSSSSPPASASSSASSSSSKPNVRATASSMEERKDAVVQVFQTQGDMAPRDLLPLVNDVLGEALLYHQLRAVLRKYKSLFESRPDQHGIWGLK